MKREFRCSTAARAACEFRETCGDSATFFEGSECHRFNEETESKGMTNADRIRAMSDEDLGKYICSLMTADNCCETCPATSLCSFGKTGLVEWMKQPVKETS